MTFGEAIKFGFNNYANFENRSQRSGFWWWFLFTNLISAACGVISGGNDNYFGSALASLAAIALLLPSLAYGVRRLHDTNRSGFHLFYGLIPIAGFIMLLIWFVQDSDTSANRFGENPKSIQ